MPLDGNEIAKVLCGRLRLPSLTAPAKSGASVVGQGFQVHYQLPEFVTKCMEHPRLAYTCPSADDANAGPRQCSGSRKDRCRHAIKSFIPNAGITDFCDCLRYSRLLGPRLRKCYPS